MKWEDEIIYFLDGIYQKGITYGRNWEHDDKKKTCKYFRYQGGVMWSDGCDRLKDLCLLETCPSKKEQVISVRK